MRTSLEDTIDAEMKRIGIKPGYWTIIMERRVIVGVAVVVGTERHYAAINFSDDPSAVRNRLRKLEREVQALRAGKVRRRRPAASEPLELKAAPDEERNAKRTMYRP